VGRPRAEKGSPVLFFSRERREERDGGWGISEPPRIRGRDVVLCACEVLSSLPVSLRCEGGGRCYYRHTLSLFNSFFRTLPILLRAPHFLLVFTADGGEEL
jgi:hypothetical protein